jgi:AraC-like DNA-binding protein
MTPNGQPKHETNPRLFLWPGRILYLGPVQDGATHAHHAVQATLSLGGPVELTMGSEPIRTQAVIIDSDRDHRLNTLGQSAAVFLIEPESNDAARLRRGTLKNGGYHLGDRHSAGPLVEALNRLERGGGCAAAASCFDQLLATWGGGPGPLPSRDERIDQVLAFIEGLPQKKVGLPELAKQVYLSESRFIHLFTEQVGIPPRRYLLWARLMDAVKGAIRAESLTSAAHTAGFADSAHLSRTFKRMFGEAPSFLVSGTKKSQFVQASLCGD